MTEVAKLVVVVVRKWWFVGAWEWVVWLLWFQEGRLRPCQDFIVLLLYVTLTKKN